MNAECQGEGSVYTASIGFTGLVPRSNQSHPTSAGFPAGHLALLSVRFLPLHSEHIGRICTKGGDENLMTQHREWWGGPGPDFP